MIVAGDSVADVGTFGRKLTVQNAANPAAGYPVYPEIVAAALGTGSLCNYFSIGSIVTVGTHSGCTDFAVGGAQIVNPSSRAGSAVPLSLQYQLEQAVKASGGAWRAGDLILVGAGPNDATALVGAYLDARDGGAADEALYLALLAQQLDSSELRRALEQPDGPAVAAALYMQRLAQTYWSTVKALTLDKGATRVAVLNVPDLTLTPRYRAVLDKIARDEGQAAASALRTTLRQSIAGFNAELARLAAGEPRVALVPYFEDFTAQSTQPAAFGLTNVTQAACPSAAEFPAECTDAALDAAPPAPGLSPGWWKSWAFSNDFHPSPRGHELIAATVNRALLQAGWR